MRFNRLRQRKTVGRSLWIEAWSPLLCGPARRRRFVRPTDELSLPVEISQNVEAFIQKEDIVVLTREFADDGSGPCLVDTVIVTIRSCPSCCISARRAP